MAISETLPLLREDPVEGAVDYKGRPVYRSTSGGWRSASFIIGVEVAERFAYFGIGANLISYLTGPLGQSTIRAAENVNAWSGTALLLPLVGAIVADSFLGRYRTILFSSLIYVLGLGLLTLSAAFTSQNTSHETISSSPPNQLLVVLFFFSLYLVALGQAGHKPCVMAFGADQFDEQDPEECKAKSSFFNWWYFCLCAAIFVTLWVLIYIQDNLNWGLGFGIPCMAMVVALAIFLLGTKRYRHCAIDGDNNPFKRIGLVFVAAARNYWRSSTSCDQVLEEEALGTQPPKCCDQFKFLDKALLPPNGESKHPWKVCSVSQVEEAKAILGLVPIWTTSFIYALVSSQTSTFFTKQASTMDRTIPSLNFTIPSASLQSFTSLTIVLFMPIYDTIFVPISRALTKIPSGITMLQRVGTGMFLTSLAMVIAALVEAKRLEIARQQGLVDAPNATVPMSFWWIVPQYVVFGVADVFGVVGLQEFFYDQVPVELRSVGVSLYLSIFGVGSFLSSFVVAMIDKATSKNGAQDGWFVDNINKAHLDYFYWVLAGIGAVELVLYLYFARSYIYNRSK